MPFDNMAINESLLDEMKKLVPNGTVLEFGSGEGTAELAKYYKVYSIEHDKEWVGKYDSTYIHAPIRSDGAINWYALKPLLAGLPEKYDVILVDGPNAKIGRQGFVKHLGLFNTNVPMFFDDAHRNTELRIIQKVSKAVGREYKVYKTKDKAFAIIKGGN